jgi:hypothetical protein
LGNGNSQWLLDTVEARPSDCRRSYHLALAQERLIRYVLTRLAKKRKEKKQKRKERWPVPTKWIGCPQNHPAMLNLATYIEINHKGE